LRSRTQRFEPTLTHVNRAASERSRFGVALGLLLKSVAIMAMIALPLAGVWVASSLAALQHGPVWLTLLTGLLLFPIVPAIWELWSAWRRRRRAKPSPRVLSITDRLILRTLAVNALFVAGLLATRPSAAFTALSARGDWMLDGHHEAAANTARAGLFAIAGKLEWLWLAAHENPFRKPGVPEPEPQPSETQAVVPNAAPSASPNPIASSSVTPAPPPKEQPKPAIAPAAPSWPAVTELDPTIVNMPKSAEASIQTVAAYVSERVPAPFARLKAVHDWVADRISYDAQSYLAGRFPPQDAETVFTTRVSVCAGYASLFEALARAAGLDVRYIVGDARTRGNDLSGQGHAWNAARIEGKWYLLDATWDSGFLNGSHFEKRYSTAYFLTPPRVFDLDHLPDDARWQLLETPLTRGEFLRQPALSPLFFASGLELLSPDRSQVDVQGSLEISLRNPQDVFLLATYETRDGHSEPQDCGIENGRTPHISCRFPRSGSYDVKLFSNRDVSGTFDFVGQLQANAN
jgi:transglutaminase-like putative cysteine protease